MPIIFGNWIFKERKKSTFFILILDFWNTISLEFNLPTNCGKGTTIVHALGINQSINMYSHNSSNRMSFSCYDILMDHVIHIMGSTNKLIPPQGWSLLDLHQDHPEHHHTCWIKPQLPRFRPTIHAPQLWSWCKHLPFKCPPWQLALWVGPHQSYLHKNQNMINTYKFVVDSSNCTPLDSFRVYNANSLL